MVPARLAEPALATSSRLGRLRGDGRREPGPEDPHARERWLAQLSQYIDEQLATGDYPQLAGLMPEGGMAAVWERMHETDVAEDRFERGLERPLDGIELDLKRRGAL